MSILFAAAKLFAAGTMQNDNRQYILRLWIAPMILCLMLGALFVAALISGDVTRMVPAIVGLVFATALIVGARWYKKRRLARMLQSADPRPFLYSFAKSARQGPSGAQMAAANTATVLALYGYDDEAERALESVSWSNSVPLIQAQRTAARAVIAYAKGLPAEGLDHAVAAMAEASLDAAVPGARMSELALRTYRNVGMALCDRSNDRIVEELREAHARLPLLGQILAAWGLAVSAEKRGDPIEYETMRSFIERHAPYVICARNRHP